MNMDQGIIAEGEAPKSRWNRGAPTTVASQQVIKEPVRSPGPAPNHQSSGLAKVASDLDTLNSTVSKVQSLKSQYGIHNKEFITLRDSLRGSATKLPDLSHKLMLAGEAILANKAFSIQKAIENLCQEGPSLQLANAFQANSASSPNKFEFSFPEDPRKKKQNVEVKVNLGLQRGPFDSQPLPNSGGQSFNIGSPEGGSHKQKQENVNQLNFFGENENTSPQVQQSPKPNFWGDQQQQPQSQSTDFWGANNATPLQTQPKPATTQKSVSDFWAAVDSLPQKAALPSDHTQGFLSFNNDFSTSHQQPPAGANDVFSNSWTKQAPAKPTQADVDLLGLDKPSPSPNLSARAAPAGQMDLLGLDAPQSPLPPMSPNVSIGHMMTPLGFLTPTMSPIQPMGHSMMPPPSSIYQGSLLNPISAGGVLPSSPQPTNFGVSNTVQFTSQPSNPLSTPPPQKKTLDDKFSDLDLLM